MNDRDRLWEIQKRVRLLAGSITLSAPMILAWSQEVDRIINRLMGIGDPRED